VLHPPWHSRCDCHSRRRGKFAAQFNSKCGRAATASQNAMLYPGRNQMSQLVAFVKSFARNEDGQDLLEYALLVALIALIAIGAVGMAGGSVKTIFTNISNQLNGAAS
jgi:pilus assembly protein Flp/PilA